MIVEVFHYINEFFKKFIIKIINSKIQLKTHFLITL